MFDLSFGELLVVGVVGLVVLGPKELPVAVKYVRGMLRSVKQTTQELQQQLTDVLDDTEDEYKKPHTIFIKGDDGTYYEAYDIGDLMQHKKEQNHDA